MTGSNPRRSPTLRPGTLALVALALSASALAHPLWHGSGLIPLSPDAATQLRADNALNPAPIVCGVDGPLVAAYPDPDPGASGLAGIVVVSGMPVRLPVGVPLQLGDKPGDNLAFTDILAEPGGFPNLLGRGASVTGALTIEAPPLGDAHAQCTADFFLVEAGHPPLIGVVTDNGPGGLFVMGVRVTPYADPRIAPFVRIQDLAGHKIPIDELPQGKLVTVGGDYDPSTNAIEALLIELDGVIPPAPGEADHLSILRVEARSARLELRARGFTNNATSTVSLFDFSAGVKGLLFASGIPVDPVDGVWDFRGDFAPVVTTPDGIPTQVLAQTTNGGNATAFVNVR